MCASNRARGGARLHFGARFAASSRSQGASVALAHALRAAVSRQGEWPLQSPLPTGAVPRSAGAAANRRAPQRRQSKIAARRCGHVRAEWGPDSAASARPLAFPRAPWPFAAEKAPFDRHRWALHAPRRPHGATGGACAGLVRARPVPAAWRAPRQNAGARHLMRVRTARRRSLRSRSPRPCSFASSASRMDTMRTALAVPARHLPIASRNWAGGRIRAPESSRRAPSLPRQREKRSGGKPTL